MSISAEFLATRVPLLTRATIARKRMRFNFGGRALSSESPVRSVLVARDAFNVEIGFNPPSERIGAMKCALSDYRSIERRERPTDCEIKGIKRGVTPC